MSLSPGTKLGPYEILAPIGEGGMGEVWKARDTRLDRPIALKVCKADFTERFEREARAVAALNHPHVCQLHDVGPNFLVMEYVEGAPLKGPLPVDKAIEYAVQILDALAAAHEKHIVHRDLKPSNILVTKQGIKLLDFGLAKQSGAILEGDDVTKTEVTRNGQFVGTLRYTSPEQLQGKAADARSDLFSFGCVLYELLSGRQAFTAPNSACLIAAILERDPTPLEVNPPLDRIVRTCLQKDPDQRFQSAIDLRRNLLWSLEQAPPARAGRRVWWRPAALMAGIIALIAGGWYVGGAARPSSPAKLPSPIRQLTFDGSSSTPALSPDGKLVAYSSGRADGNIDIYVQQIDGGAPIRLTDDSAVDTNPAFSADGSKIYFDSYRDPNGIYEVSALGGETRLLVPFAFKPRPSPQGKYIGYWKAGRWHIDTLPLGRAITLESPPAELINSNAAWIAEGRFWAANGGPPVTAAAPAFSATPDPLQSRKYFSDGSFQFTDGAVALASGEFLFSAQRGDAFNLWRAPQNDPESLPVPITLGVSRTRIRASAAGNRVVFTQTSGVTGLWRLPSDLDAGRVSGPLERLTSDGAGGAHQDITPDGAWLVYCGSRLGAQGIHLREMSTGKERSVMQPATNAEALSHTIISPDGKRILAYQNAPSSQQSRQRMLLIQSRDGQARQIAAGFVRFRGWLPDGRTALIWSGRAVETLDTDTGRRSPVLPEEKEVAFSEPRLTRDGKWLAFLRATGIEHKQLYVAPFDGDPIPRAKWIHVADNVSQPVWSPDGRSLYFVDQTLGAADGARTVIRRQRLSVDHRPEGVSTVFTEFAGYAFGNGVINPIAVGRQEMILAMASRVTDLWTMELR